jgi:hypothetical protein
MTNSPMNHDEARDLLAALAFDSLDATDEARVLAHVTTCSECAAELKELRAAAATMAFATQSRHDIERAAAVKGRLMARVQASKDATLAPPGIRTAKSGGTFANRAAIAASILILASSSLSVMLWRDRATLRDALASLNERESTAKFSADSLRTALIDRDKLIAGLTGRDMAMVRLTSNATQEAWALMFWNRATNGWTFVGHNLPAPKAGRTYQLWLVTANAKISAGTFAPGANGEIVVRATYALSRDALKAVAVTDEPAGGVAQPTGAFVVIGAIN